MANQDELWLETLESLLHRKELRLNRMAATLRSGTKAIANLNAEIEAHKGRKGQPAVLVRRTAGPRVEIYHSAQHPCGRAANRASFQQILLGEAVDRGLRSCSACAWDLRLSDEPPHTRTG
jgi:hypothetical protein